MLSAPVKIKIPTSMQLDPFVGVEQRDQPEVAYFSIIERMKMSRSKSKQNTSAPHTQARTEYTCMLSKLRIKIHWKSWIEYMN